MGYKYPSMEEVSQDVTHETTAINTAVDAISDALSDCPLKEHLKVYAAIEFAFKCCEMAYVEEVFKEIYQFKAKT